MDERLTATHTYRLKQELFRRGLAVSYLAEDEDLHDEVVIQRVTGHRDDPDASRNWLLRYRSVAVRVMRLRHHNHVAIRDFHTDFRTFVLLVKQSDAGGLLDQLLRSPHPPELTAGARLGLCRDILRGLAALHAHGIVHRDIKPGGIYVRAGGGGVAQIDHFHLSVPAADVYADDDLCGTPLYMAPELLGGGPRPYSRRSDVYAAGLV